MPSISVRPPICFPVDAGRAVDGVVLFQCESGGPIYSDTGTSRAALLFDQQLGGQAFGNSLRQLRTFAGGRGSRSPSSVS